MGGPGSGPKKAFWSWPRTKARLLYEAGFSSREICRYFDGCSKQYIGQLLREAGVPPQRRGRKNGFRLPALETSELTAMGLAPSDLRRLLGRVAATAPDAPRLDGFGTVTVARAYYEARDLILATAKMDGASSDEVAALAGWNLSPGSRGSDLVARLRARGLHCPPCPGY